MSDDDAPVAVDDFDPTAMKKKKKKKVTLDLDASEDDVGTTPGKALDGDEEENDEVQKSMEDLTLDDGEFGKKKKKKSKEKKTDVVAAAEEEEDDPTAASEEFGKKKKSKKKKKIDGEDEDGEEEVAREATNTGSGTSWDGTTRDYHYDEMLGRVFGILREKNPALSEKSKTIIKPPNVLREGTKKTVFANVMEICTAMHRPSEHVIQYLLAEMGTSGTLDGSQRLVLKGRFLPKVFEGVLRHYFLDYVICNMCKSSDTLLVREQSSRLSYCRCQSCGASRSVSTIQKGFTAVGKGDRRKARLDG